MKSIYVKDFCEGTGHSPVTEFRRDIPSPKIRRGGALCFIIIEVLLSLMSFCKITVVVILRNVRKLSTGRPEDWRRSILLGRTLVARHRGY